MEEFDLKDVWSTGHQSTPNLKPVDEAAKANRKKSLNIVDTIVTKTKIDWFFSGVICMIIGVCVILFEGNLTVYVAFILPFLFYFIDSVRRLQVIKSFDNLNTLEYLKRVDKYIYKSNEQQIKIIIFVIAPYSLILGYFFGFKIGVEDKGGHWTDFFEITEGSLKRIMISIVMLSLIFWGTTKVAPKFLKNGINIIYGKQLKEIKEMISTLEEEV
ncbi:hypothetical protein [Flammeovirga kamogawensis]|uniref:RDD family protein n=1 Tax=Flammeovirga kamogawensis TaxID=373891 RepID=A0ABX8GYW4_9BACT|nr:hypothetical protein [Flammeovirga kamogawensis]MBB6459195.1 ABC-type multidrug transport system fused ATPase/permease subunit [Flammeovirga kamogawensis]QWG08760.1 hypothetical protein KM029_07415 [Flammeovirga kamogawensis]TRX67052.1 hypothetical protein EO216_02460 [Flammeovirga kamogawensis]